MCPSQILSRMATGSAVQCRGWLLAGWLAAPLTGTGFRPKERVSDGRLHTSRGAAEDGDVRTAIGCGVCVCVECVWVLFSFVCRIGREVGWPIAIRMGLALDPARRIGSSGRRAVETTTTTKKRSVRCVGWSDGESNGDGGWRHRKWPTGIDQALTHWNGRGAVRCARLGSPHDQPAAGLVTRSLSDSYLLQPHSRSGADRIGHPAAAAQPSPAQPTTSTNNTQTIHNTRVAHSISQTPACRCQSRCH